LPEADGQGRSLEQSDAAIEAHQLRRDLALIVIHGQHGVEAAGLGAEEDGAGVAALAPRAT
jgi:hypothetical protein